MGPAILYSAIMFGVAFILSMGVALLMKLLFILVHHFNKDSEA